MSVLETKSTDSIGQVWVVVDEDGGTGVMDTHEDQFVMEPASVADLVAALAEFYPLTAAALQAGAEERVPDYLAGQRFANRGDSGDWGLSDLDLAEVEGIIDAAIGGSAVVLVPRSEQ